MVLSPGTRLGPYEIAHALGAGGMGEVYRARDSRLKRHVAIKVLPDAFARDTERVARFQREAEALASLNHPNIGLIYDLQEDAGTRFLVLELVEGETLADRLRGGPLAAHEALDVCRQVAEALEAAHDRDILHRDLKPANIILQGSGGSVKVIDFGLAKMLEPAEGTAAVANSPTISVAHTGRGRRHESLTAVQRVARWSALSHDHHHTRAHLGSDRGRRQLDRGTEV